MTVYRYSVSRFMCTINKKYNPYSGTSAIYTVANNMHESVNCMPSCSGKGLAHFLSYWEILTQDQWVLQAMAGYQLELLTTPYQTTYPHPMNGSKEQAQITREVAELLSKGTIQETQLLPESFVSQIFLVEKKDGGQRLVVNLKHFNQFMRVEKRWRASISFQT